MPEPLGPSSRHSNDAPEGLDENQNVELAPVDAAVGEVSGGVPPEPEETATVRAAESAERFPAMSRARAVYARVPVCTLVRSRVQVPVVAATVPRDEPSS